MEKLVIVAAIALLATMADSLPANESSGVVLTIALPDELIVDSVSMLSGIKLRLTNHTDRPSYVSPGIGQLEGHLRIRARRPGSKALPVVLHDKGFSGGGNDLQDLFRLLPNRTLELDLNVSYPDATLAGREGLIEVWAEYDCRGMKKFGDEALATILVSEPAVARVMILGEWAPDKGDSASRGRTGQR
jgi:hypothetical protein